MLSISWSADASWSFSSLPPSRPAAWPLIPSLLLHLLVVALLAWATVGRPTLPRQVRAIEVDLIDPIEYEDAFEVPPDVAVAPLAAPTYTDTPDAAPPVPDDGMTAATELLANRVLSDPQNRQVRETLPQLEKTERITQLCVIEGLEQLRLARPGTLPDSISPSAFAPTLLRGLRLDAPDAAFRVDRHWYGLRFSCTVAPDLSAVAAYLYAIGDAVPAEKWEPHDLIAEDEDE